MSEKYQPPKRTWFVKFRDTFRGIALGIRGQTSFAAHLLMTASVVIAGVVLRVSLIEWCVLVLCIAVVLGAEMFNSALETLAKAIDEHENDHLRRGLDIAGAAVLVLSIGAAITGGIVFIYRLGVQLEWWI